MEYTLQQIEENIKEYQETVGDSNDSPLYRDIEEISDLYSRLEKISNIHYIYN